MEKEYHLNALPFAPTGFELDGCTIDNPHLFDGVTSKMSSVMDTVQFYGQQLTRDYNGYIEAFRVPELQNQMPCSNPLVKPSILVADPSTYMDSRQQMPQSYVEFLSESGISELHNQMEWNFPDEATGFVPANTSSCMEVQVPPSSNHKLITDQKRRGEVEEVETFIRLSNQNYSLKEKLNEEANHNLIFQSSQVNPAPHYPYRIHSEALKKRARETDRLRKLKVSKSLKALQELVPHAMEAGQESAIDHIIDYIKHLQLQMKDLSRTRLGDESVSTYPSFEQEHAHYLLDDEILHNPLEEMTGKLLEDNFSRAMQLLQSRGLILMPMSLADRLS